MSFAGENPASLFTFYGDGSDGFWETGSRSVGGGVSQGFTSVPSRCRKGLAVRRLSSRKGILEPRKDAITSCIQGEAVGELYSFPLLPMKTLTLEERAKAAPDHASVIITWGNKDGTRGGESVYTIQDLRKLLEKEVEVDKVEPLHLA